MLSYKILFISFFLLLTSTIAFGVDSTLYKKRVEKIIKLAEWLNSNTHFTFDSRRPDTSLHSKIYDSADKMFFKKPLYKTRYNLKMSLCEFNYILREFPIDSFLLKMPDPNRDVLIKRLKLHNYLKNTIIFYFPMYGEEFEGLYFSFADNSETLIYMITAGGSHEEYKTKKKFLDKLH